MNDVKNKGGVLFFFLFFVAGEGLELFVFVVRLLPSFSGTSHGAGWGLERVWEMDRERKELGARSGREKERDLG